MSNLASVQKIIALNPIEGADLIEKATVLGWELVVKKGDFKVGDLAGYIQIDTVVPETVDFEFLRPRNFRVRTIKLKGQISQGLLVPLPKVCNSSVKWKEGEDLTEILNIKKYSKPEEAVKQRVMRIPKSWYGKLWRRFQFIILFKLFSSLEDKFFPQTSRSFPSDLVSKTDEERIQNMPNILEKYKGKKFVSSEKLDGSSITIINGKKLRVCSRNNEMLSDENEWSRTVINTNFAIYISDLVKYFATDNIIVQGEMIGRPQGNKYKLDKNEIRLFNILVDGKRIMQDDFYQVCNKYNIPTCPYIETITLDHTLQDIIKVAEGKSILNKNTEREGLVFRCIEDGKSFKSISNKFLLKNEE